MKSETAQDFQFFSLVVREESVIFKNNSNRQKKKREQIENSKNPTTAKKNQVL